MNKSFTDQKTILVADDDPAIVDALQFMLEENGYNVITSVDGATINVMVQQQPDLLLLDIWMSGEDGRDICAALKAQSKTKHIPIIMVSANKETEKIAKLCGANDFLAKPFEMTDLLQKIKKNVSGQRSARRAS